MDYEKKYNEALKRAEAAINIAADKDLVKGVATTIFPELRESEDERIRKHLIEIVETYWGTTNDPGKAADLAYLEKQKETHIPWYDLQKSKEAGYTILKTEEYEELIKQKEQKEIPLMNGNADLYFDNWRQEKQGSPTKRQCFEEGMRYAQRLQKEHQNNSDAPNESSWSGIISSSDKDKNLDEIAQDYVEAVKEYNPEPTWDLMQTAVCYGYHYREGEEQKPASTEDMPYITDEHFYEREPADSFKYKLAEYMTKCCTKKEGPYGYTYGISSESILEMAKEELIKRGELQKPVWSEEDDEMRLEAIRVLVSGCERYRKESGCLPSWHKVISWLKSLRPQPKVELSEDVKKTLDEVSHILVGLNYKQIAKDYKQAIEELLHSRSSWKPSEEQLEALRVTIDFMPDTFKPRCTLITLQNGLEKLM